MGSGKRGARFVLVAVIVFFLMSASWAALIFAVTRPGTSYDPSRIKLNVNMVTRDQLLTCAYKVYGDDTWHFWVGKTIIRNKGKVPVYDLKVSYKVTDYCEWTTNKTYPVVLPGETVRDFFFPAFKGESVMAVTTKTPADLTMKYEYKDLPKPVTQSRKIFFLGKNDYIYSSLPEDEKYILADRDDNYPFIAAFVTPNEETTKSFAEMATAGLSPSGDDEDALLALHGVFKTMGEHGVRYVHEPSMFWTGESGQYVQYPKETINRKAGTCLDLAVCFASMMEAVGVQSFIIFLPGHAMPAIRLPESGGIVYIESTGVEYADLLTPEEAVRLAEDEITEANENGDYLTYIDLERWWKKGIVPPW